MASNRGSPASYLSKERLKNELVAHGLRLPPSGSKKEVYVQLYEKNIATNASGSLRSEFSSDEEEQSPRLLKRKIKSIFTAVNDEGDDAPSLIVGDLNIAELSDEELADRLRSLKFNVGPIVDTTRLVYQRKLARILRGAVDGEVSNQTYDDDYSDSDDTHSRHSSTPMVNHKSSEEFEDIVPPSGLTDVRKRLPGAKGTFDLRPDDDVSEQAYSPYKPTPRPGLRSGITYTPVDRSKYPNLLLSHLSTPGSIYNSNSVSSTTRLEPKLVVEQAEELEEREPPKRSRKFILLWVLLIAVTVVLALLTYQNMEEDSTDKIDISSDKLYLPADSD